MRQAGTVSTPGRALIRIFKCKRERERERQREREREGGRETEREKFGSLSAEVLS